MSSNSKLTILVSSTVYGIEELLDRIYTLLTSFGYEVWMSHKGTVPVFSDKSSFENCIYAVEKCDLFLGLITPYYGSGQADGISITHQELRKAKELNKPRWILSHDHIVFARKLLNDLGYSGNTAKWNLKLKKKASSLNDLQIIDMYEEAVLSNMPLTKRQGNWVQKYRKDDEALLFVTAQFFRYQEVEEFLKENLSDPSKINDTINGKGI